MSKIIHCVTKYVYNWDPIKKGIEEWNRSNILKNKDENYAKRFKDINSCIQKLKKK